MAAVLGCAVILGRGEMPGHSIHIDVDGGYYRQGADLTVEQKQEAADEGARATQAKLAEYGATFPQGDLAGAIHDPSPNP
jgi:hypothetical protein